MENDLVRTIGDSTLVDMWLGGKLRSISISREAIAEFMGLNCGQGAALSDSERSDFVRSHLTLVAAAAAAWLKDDAGAGAITIETGQLRREDSVRAPDRRQTGDRRRGDRRRTNLGAPAGGERRRKK